MKTEIRRPIQNQEYDLADLRAKSMKESLQAIGRYNDVTVRRRLLDSYSIENTNVIFADNELAGFYTLEYLSDHIFIRHFYIDPTFQRKGIGSEILNLIIISSRGKPIQLKALKGSKANDFYINNGFVKYSEEEFDNCYEFRHHNKSEGQNG